MKLYKNFKLKEKLLNDIEKFKKHYNEPDHSDYIFLMSLIFNINKFKSI